MPRDRLIERVLRCLAGLVLCGVGIATIIAAHLGVAPWDVLHQGISDRIGLPIGTVILLLGVVVLTLWWPLGIRPGVGTILNAALIGVFVDLTDLGLPDARGVAAQISYLLVGIAAIGVGSGLYIGAGLGPGPRDGLMTGIAARGFSLRATRTVLEVAVLVAGWLLGGSVGIGTVLFAVTIGPNVHWCLERMSLEPLAVVHPGPIIEVE